MEKGSEWFAKREEVPVGKVYNNTTEAEEQEQGNESQPPNDNIYVCVCVCLPNNAGQEICSTDAYILYAR